MNSVYRGFIVLGDWGENYDALGLEPTASPLLDYLTEEPLALRLQNDREQYGPFASVRYFVSAEEKPVEQLTEDLARRMVGDVEAEYGDRYSEITGYLWTDEEVTVGGHDLLAELASHKGNWLHLEIEWSKARAEVDRGE